MKNFAYKSSIIASNGDIHIGDIHVANIYNYEQYVTITDKIELKKSEKSALEIKYSEKKNNLISDPNNKDLSEFVSHIELNLFNLDKEITSLKEEVESFLEELISTLNLCLKEHVKSSKTELIENYILDGKIILAKSVVSLDSSIREREMLADTIRYTNERIVAISNELLFTAKATLLDITNPDRISEAEILYLESINTYKSFENQFEYANYLSKYNLKKAPEVYQNLLDEYTASISIEQRADILSELAFCELQNRMHDKAIVHYEEALQIISSLIEATTIVNIHYLAKKAEYLRHLATTNDFIQEKTKAAEYFKSAFDILKEINASSTIFTEGYINVLIDYLGFNLLSKNYKIAYNIAHEILEYYEKVDNLSDLDKIEIAIVMADYGYLLYIDQKHTESYNMLHRAENIILSIPTIYSVENLSVVALMYQKLSVIYNVSNIDKSIDYIKTAINTLVPRLRVSPIETKELIAMFTIELALLEKSKNNYANYIENLNLSLNWLNDVIKANPYRSFKEILGSFQKLIINNYNILHRDISKIYLEKLISVFELCHSYNQSMWEFKVLIARAKFRLGFILTHLFNDRNKSIQFYTEILKLLGFEDFNNSEINRERNAAMHALMDLGQFEIQIEGKPIKFRR